MPCPMSIVTSESRGSMRASCLHSCRVSAHDHVAENVSVKPRPFPFVHREREDVGRRVDAPVGPVQLLDLLVVRL